MRDQPGTIAVALQPLTVVRGIKVALVVGTLLNLLNHAPALVAGSASWWSLAVNYLVPFCVSVYSSARADLHAAREAAALPIENSPEWNETPMVRATWNGVVLAESDDTLVIDGYHYFPRDAVRFEHLRANGATTTCGWKGTAHYFDVEAGGERNPSAAWLYPTPMPAAAAIAGRIAFWRGVEIS